MKYKVFALLTILATVFALAGMATPVKAAAYGTSFITSVTFQNVGDAASTIKFTFYAEADGTPIEITRPDLPKGAGTSVYLGSLGDITPGFRGSAMISSSQPLVATLVQIDPTGTIKNRALSNGFSEGAAYVLIPTVLKNTFNTNSIFSVQNVDGDPADVTIKLVPVSGSSITITESNLPAGAAKYYDLGAIPEIAASSFNGSAQITAKKAGTSTDGMVVATSMELFTTGDGVYAFEGAMETSDTIYMPSALCKYNSQDSSYAVQNTETGNVNVTVTYSNGKSEGPFTLAGGAKKSLPGCGTTGTLNPAGFIGSAKITATGGNIVAVGKIYGGGLSTAFLGFPAGAAKVALPYVRWTTAHWDDGTRQRAYIAIQNVGDSDLAAGAVTVTYIDKNGTVVGTHTLGAIAKGAKTNSNASLIGAAGAEFGAYPDGSFGGGAIVQGPSGSQLAVVVRVVTANGAAGLVGEDYNGIVVP